MLYVVNTQFGIIKHCMLVIEQKSVYMAEETMEACKVAHFSFGGKCLTLEVYPRYAVTRIDNTGLSHITGETTMLYTAAQQYIEHMASRCGRPLQYQFRTTFPKMIAWALTTGNDIFNWESVRYETDEVDGLVKLIAETEILPSQALPEAA